MINLRLTLKALLLTGVLIAACSPKDDKDRAKIEPTAGGDGLGEGGSGASSAGKGGNAPGEAGNSNGGADGEIGGSEALGGSDAAGGEGAAGGAPPIEGNGGAGWVEYVEDDTLGAPAVVVWKEDFEGEAVNWSVTGGVWAVGAVTNVNGPAAFGGTGVAGTGLTLNYGASNNAYLISPKIDVPAAKQHPRFRVHYWYDFAAGDNGYVYLRVDSGNWQLLSTVNQSGDGSWRQMVVDLSEYADRSVELGFRIVSNATAFAPGFFIDDASFETGPQPFDKTESFEGDWGYWSAYNGVWAIGKPTAVDGPRSMKQQPVRRLPIGVDLVMYVIELLLGDSRELDANADSHSEPTFNREHDPSRRVSHSATCHALIWASVLWLSRGA